MALSEKSTSEEEVVQEKTVSRLRQDYTREVILEASAFSLQEFQRDVSSILADVFKRANGGWRVKLAGSAKEAICGQSGNNMGSRYICARAHNINMPLCAGTNDFRAHDRHRFKLEKHTPTASVYVN